ncbi:MAG: elongation factor G [Polyangiaceae bacterium]
MSSNLVTERLRTLGIIAHIDAGKTTCTERLLYYTGKIHRVREVHDGEATMDFTDEERRRGITIGSAATSTRWSPKEGSLAGVEHHLQLLDTPGHVDFTIEVERCLRVLDGAVAIFDAGNGVEPQSETVWRQADRHAVARVVFINKMDKTGADFDMCLRSIRTRLGANAVAVQLPLGEQHEHCGIIDLLRMRAFEYSTRAGDPPVEVPLPDLVVNDAEEARCKLVEACCDIDDGLLAKYLESGPDAITAHELEHALRIGTLTRKVVPVLCGSAYQNIGIEPLLDAIVAYLPSPVDLPPVHGLDSHGQRTERMMSNDEPLCAFAFKTTHDRTAGAITWLRVYSGQLRPGSKVELAGRHTSERIGRLMSMHANHTQDISIASTGMIVAALGLRSARTGDTLCDGEHEIALESFDVPDPVVTLAIEPTSNADQDRLALALHKLSADDPSLRLGHDEDTGRALISGMGELHLEVVVSKLLSDHGVRVSTGNPSVSYRETITRTARADYKLAQQNGGSGMFARVVLEVSPCERGQGFRFVDDTRGGVIPKEFVPAIEKGILGALKRGRLAGYPVVDLEAHLVDGATHVKDSNAMAFELAASHALQAATLEAGLVLLEPWMQLEISTPESSLGTVLGDLASRRGLVRSIDVRAEQSLVHGSAPLAELFGYVPSLRGLSHGRASATMQPSHFEKVPTQ